MPNARAAAPDPVALVGRLARRGLTGTQIVQELKARHGLRLSASAVAAIVKPARAAASAAKTKAGKAMGAKPKAMDAKPKAAKAKKPTARGGKPATRAGGARQAVPAKPKQTAGTPRKAAAVKAATGKTAPKPATNGKAAAPAKPAVNGHSKGPANGIATLPATPPPRAPIAAPAKLALKPPLKPPAPPGSIGTLGAMQCAFPITLDRPFKFCGNRVAGLRIAGQAGATSPYCALHHEQCYQRKGTSGQSRSSHSGGIKPIGR